MFQTIYSATPPDTLLAYLEAGKDVVQFRRRAVLTRSEDKDWVLVCGTVEALPGESPPVQSRVYEHTVLYEDRITAQQCRKFVDELEQGTVNFGNALIASGTNPRWELDLVPLVNMYMSRAGRVARIRFAPKANSDWRLKGPLLAKDLPFYSDVTDAVRDWLPFKHYHGESDARNHQLVFLLPEFRAAFAGATFADGAVEISAEGTEVGTQGFLVKGSYWSDGAMTHFDRPLKEGKVHIEIPDDVEQLAYVLIDSEGVVYDFQREDRFGHTGLGRKRLNDVDLDLVEQIRNATRTGEGSHIEFKPFIDPDQSIGDKDKKTKLRELLTTVVAFANTDGGRIYVGIDDDCALADISPKLGGWAKSEVSDQTIERYCGALRGVIRDWIIGDMPLRVSHANVDGALVVVVDVEQVAQPVRPVILRGDKAFYVRAGASNTQLPPDQWAAALGKTNHDGVFPLGGL